MMAYRKIIQVTKFPMGIRNVHSHLDEIRGRNEMHWVGYLTIMLSKV
jgi:hypothetical protein